MSFDAGDRTEVLGRRIGAALLDFVVLFVLFLVLALLIGDSSAGDGGAQVSLNGWPAAVFFALALLYHFVTEAATGRTLGKRLLGLRVATVDGGSPSAGQVALRTLLRIIDGIAFYLVGLVVVLVSGSRRQRLGDMAARTRVVAG